MARSCSPQRLLGRLEAWLAASLVVAALLLRPQTARANDWKYDVVHLKNGKVFKGLLQQETPAEIKLDCVRRNVGARTTVFRTAFSLAEVERIERLPPAERRVLAARLQALDPSGEDETVRMESLDIKPAPWG